MERNKQKTFIEIENLGESTNINISGAKLKLAQSVAVAILEDQNTQDILLIGMAAAILKEPDILDKLIKAYAGVRVENV